VKAFYNGLLKIFRRPSICILKAFAVIDGLKAGRARRKARRSREGKRAMRPVKGQAI
jgi:hypothetical protein